MYPPALKMAQDDCLCLFGILFSILQTRTGHWLWHVAESVLAEPHI